MKLYEFIVNRINITYAYDQLDRDFISRDKIRRAISEKPIITDLPDVLLVSYPQQGSNIIFDDKRAIINIPVKRHEDLASSFELLSSLGTVIYETIEKGDMIAYGFNFDGFGKVEKEFTPIGNYFKEIFFKQIPLLEECFEGKIVRVSPKFSLKKEEYDFNISFEPTDEVDVFSFYLNVHFDNGTIPSAEELNISIQEKHDLFRRLLETI